MKKLIEIKVACLDAYDVKGKKVTVNMVPFTGEAYGEYFTGKTVGIGVDTQRYEENVPGKLSARYMLEGTDFSGEKCRIFIENNTRPDGIWRPEIITDSKALAHWEDIPKRAIVDPIEGGVLVTVYEE